MARAYVTEKQVGREYWFFAVAHAARMINQVPGRLGRKLTSPFELVHGHKPDSRTWFELFSIGYFQQEKDGSATRSNTEDHSLDGIAVGRDDRTNTIVFYNPLTKSYYRPPAFRLDEGRLPATNFPSLKYDGGLTCGSYRDRTDPVPKPFPPGTRVSIERDDDPSRRGTVQTVPAIWSSTVSSSADMGELAPEDDARYTILFDDGTQANVPFIDLAKPASTTATPSPPGNNPFSSLPHFLQRGSKITLDHEGQFVKGFLSHDKKEGFTIDVRRNSRRMKVD
jgi:hypothetical protein